MLHEKVKNQRHDYLHKISRHLVDSYDTICLEDLAVSNMVKNRNLSRAISDMGWTEFCTMLKYKAEWSGKNIQVIGRFDPSSKTCSSCGKINKELTLSMREWACVCGATHDRDVNAAINIKNIWIEEPVQHISTRGIGLCVICRSPSHQLAVGGLFTETWLLGKLRAKQKLRN